MVYIDAHAYLESFRRFLINSTCRSFIPESYWHDPEVFPEKEGETGSIYVEAADKMTLKKMQDITFINARDVLGIIYVSKSGNSRLKWRQVRGKVGRVSGEASTNSLVNMFESRVLTQEYVEAVMKGEQPVSPPPRAEREEEEEIASILAEEPGGEEERPTESLLARDDI